MGRVTESIYSGAFSVVPLADVQHVEKWKDGQLIVVTKHSRWDFERDFWANNINIAKEEAPQFMAAWCRYRSELESETLADLGAPSPENYARTILDWRQKYEGGECGADSAMEGILEAAQGILGG